jgi:hypothetical protein
LRIGGGTGGTRDACGLILIVVRIAPAAVVFTVTAVAAVTLARDARA